jgi:hypothetical protein
MMNSLYWETVFQNSKMDTLPSEVTYPIFEGAMRSDVIFHNVQLIDLCFNERMYGNL